MLMIAADNTLAPTTTAATSTKAPKGGLAPAAPAMPLKDALNYCLGAGITRDEEMFATVFDLLKAGRLASVPQEVALALDGLRRWEAALQTNLPDPTMPRVWTDVSNILRGWSYYAANYLPHFPWKTELQAAVYRFDGAISANAAALSRSVLAASTCLPEQQRRDAAVAAATATTASDQAAAASAQVAAEVAAQAAADQAAAIARAARGKLLLVGGAAVAGVVAILWALR